MRIIQHRINSIQALAGVPAESGIEFDIRTFNDSMVLNHEPMQNGESVADLLSRSGTLNAPLIFNVKEDGLEEMLLELIQANEVREYFFLDSQVPTIMRLHEERNMRSFAARYSHVENLDYVFNMKPYCEWVWVDCFPGFFPKIDELREMQSAGFRLCVASPELQPKNTREISTYKDIKGILGPDDAVCTKKPQVWQEL